jgi:hypothetical protein
MKKIEYLSIATNALTFKCLNFIQIWATEKGIQTIATEILRAHTKRPGIYMYAYMYIYLCINIYIYIYVYICIFKLLLLRY